MEKKVVACHQCFFVGSRGLKHIKNLELRTNVFVFSISDSKNADVLLLSKVTNFPISVRIGLKCMYIEADSVH